MKRGVFGSTSAVIEQNAGAREIPATARIRRVDHTHRPAVDEHDHPLHEVAATVREQKASPGRELQVHGSGALFPWLLDNDLADEMTLFTFPWSSARARGCSLTPAGIGRLQ